MLELNLRGEMKVAALRDSSFLKDLSLVGKLADAMKLSSVEVTRLNPVYFIFFTVAPHCVVNIVRETIFFNPLID